VEPRTRAPGGPERGKFQAYPVMATHYDDIRLEEAIDSRRAIQRIDDY
jgi:hypothetical protein